VQFHFEIQRSPDEGREHIEGNAMANVKLILVALGLTQATQATQATVGCVDSDKHKCGSFPVELREHCVAKSVKTDDAKSVCDGHRWSRPFYQAGGR